MRARLSQLSVAQKLMLMSIFFLLPDTLMLCMMLSDIHDNIKFARLEREGLSYLHPLVRLIHLLPEHQRVASLSPDNVESPADLIRISSEIDQALLDLQQTDARYAQDLSFTDAELARRERTEARPGYLLADWKKLTKSDAHADPKITTAIYQHMLADARMMLVHIGDMSNLILDPDLDTYYLMDVTLLALPQAQDQLEQAIGDGETLLKNRQGSRTELANLHAQILQDLALDHVSGSINTSLREDNNFRGATSAFQQRMPAALDAYREAVGAFIQLTRELGRADSQSQVTPTIYLSAGIRARQACMDLWTVSAANLDVMLLHRITCYQTHRWICLLVTFMAMLAAAMMVGFINRSINRPLVLQTEALRRSNRMLNAEMQQRKAAQAQLLDASRRAGMAEIAAGVLHNVGNVLNSVNTSTTLIRETIDHSRVPLLGKAAAMIQQHCREEAFLTWDPMGRKLPELLSSLALVMSDDQKTVDQELTRLSRSVEHIKHIVQAQQSLAKTGAEKQAVDLTQAIEDALRICDLSREQGGLEIVREYNPCGQVLTDGHKVLQALVNLITNARKAVLVNDVPVRRITLGLQAIQDSGAAFARISVSDTGVGIARENLTKIFQHGFTTRKDGHGVGLHSAAIDIRHLGGCIRVDSAGIGQGATFTLDLPLHAESEANETSSNPSLCRQTACEVVST